jgi:hypothetical protein
MSWNGLLRGASGCELNDQVLVLSMDRNSSLCLHICAGSKVHPGEKAPLLGTPKDMLSKALEWASVSIGALLLGNMEGRSFLRAFEIKRYTKRYVQCPVSGHLSL